MENTKPKVSIAIISYNQIEFIEEAVMNALNQDYENLEVIVADDGSTDGTAEFLNDLEKEHYPRLKVDTSGPNIGITGNSNRALFACSGDYICLQGGDDVMLPGKIKSQLLFMLSNSYADVSYHEAAVFNSYDGRILYYYNDALLNRIRTGNIEDMILEPFICAGTAMIKRSSFPEYGFNKFSKIASDWLMWIEMLYSNRSFLYMPGVYLKYRIHSNNITSTKESINNVDQINILKMIILKYGKLKRVSIFKLRLLVTQEAWFLLRKGYFRKAYAVIYNSAYRPNLLSFIYSVRRSLSIKENLRRGNYKNH